MYGRSWCNCISVPVAQAQSQVYNYCYPWNSTPHVVKYAYPKRNLNPIWWQYYCPPSCAPCPQTPCPQTLCVYEKKEENQTRNPVFCCKCVCERREENQTRNQECCCNCNEVSRAQPQPQVCKCCLCDSTPLPAKNVSHCCSSCDRQEPQRMSRKICCKCNDTPRVQAQPQAYNCYPCDSCPLPVKLVCPRCSPDPVSCQYCCTTCATPCVAQIVCACDKKENQRTNQELCCHCNEGPSVQAQPQAYKCCPCDPPPLPVIRNVSRCFTPSVPCPQTLCICDGEGNHQRINQEPCCNCNETPESQAQPQIYSNNCCPCDSAPLPTAKKTFNCCSAQSVLCPQKFCVCERKENRQTNQELCCNCNKVSKAQAQQQSYNCYPCDSTPVPVKIVCPRCNPGPVCCQYCCPVCSTPCLPCPPQRSSEARPEQFPEVMVCYKVHSDSNGNGNGKKLARRNGCDDECACQLQWN